MKNSISQQPVKKPYQKPNLKVYGSIETMTGTATSLGAVPDVAEMGNKTA